MVKYLLVIFCSVMAYSLEAQRFSRGMFNNNRPANYNTVPDIPPPSKEEIRQHEQEERSKFLSFVSEEKPEELPISMETKQKPASWKFPLTDFKTESRLRYLTAMDIMIIVIGTLIVVWMLVYLICRDIRSMGYSDGFHDATYDRTMKRSKVVVDKGTKRDFVIIYVDSEEFKECPGEKSDM